jgi:hypothetical protein
MAILGGVAFILAIAGYMLFSPFAFTLAIIIGLYLALVIHPGAETESKAYLAAKKEYQLWSREQTRCFLVALCDAPNLSKLSFDDISIIQEELTRRRNHSVDEKRMCGVGLSA